MTCMSRSAHKPLLKNARAQPPKSVLIFVQPAGTKLDISKNSTLRRGNMLLIRLWRRGCKHMPIESPDSSSLMHLTRRAPATRQTAAPTPSEQRCGRYTRSMKSRSAKQARSATKTATLTGLLSTLGGKASHRFNPFGHRTAIRRTSLTDERCGAHTLKSARRRFEWQLRNGQTSLKGPQLG